MSVLSSQFTVSDHLGLTWGELILKHLDFTEMLENIEKAKEDLERNVNKRLVLENLFIPFVP